MYHTELGKSTLDLWGEEKAEQAAEVRLRTRLVTGISQLAARLDRAQSNHPITNVQDMLSLEREQGEQ
jgi:hypothetical protein